MDTEIPRMFTKAEQLAGQKRMFEACRIYQDLLGRRLQSVDQALAIYNLGVVHRSLLGDGVEARRLFNEVNKLLTNEKAPSLQMLRANALENAMVLASSYEGYEAMAERLRAIRPDYDVLRGQWPWVQEYKDQGKPWAEVLFTMANGYYSRSPDREDHKLYGEAASTYSLMLANRKGLRLNRERWQRAIIEHTALCLKHGSETMMAVQRQNPLTNFEDWKWFGRVALKFSEEYLIDNPEDSDVRQFRDNAQSWMQTINAVRPSEGIRADSDPDLPEAPHGPCPRCSGEVILPADRCPHCGQTLVRFHLAALRALAAGLSVFFILQKAAPGLPQWASAAAGFVVANAVFLFSVSSPLARIAMQSRPRLPERTIAAPYLGGMQRTGPIMCPSCHRRMDVFEDEGILLAACRAEGVVRPVPGSLYSTEALRRAAGKYDKFDM
jgi:hypothetical protein